MIYFSGSLYYFGGKNSDDRLYKYDLTSLTWTAFQILNAPLTRSLFGVAEYNGFLYVLPGWNDFLQNDIGDIRRIDLKSTNSIWESLQVDESTSELARFPRDSYGLAVNGKLVYFTCGYTTYGLANDIIELDLSQTLMKFKRLTDSGKVPEARKDHSTHLVNTKVYVFGGEGQFGKLDDLWTFDLVTEQWTQEKLYGDMPTPRSGSASCSNGDLIYYFGGEGNSQLLKDFYILDTQTKEFRQIDSIEWPTARKDACMLCKFPRFGIFGGVTVNGYENDLYIIDLRYDSITLISNSDESGPVPSANMQCSVDIRSNELFFQIVVGESYGESPISTVYEISAKTLRWTLLGEVGSRSQTASQNFGDRLLIAGGQSWGFERRDEVIKFERSTGKSSFIGVLSSPMYNGGSFYFKSALYLHGGGSVLGNKFRPKVATNHFFRLEMNEDCESTGCDWPCSPGTYYSTASKDCIYCPEGTYSTEFGQSRCTECPAGSASNRKGNTSIRQCYPCPENYYAPTAGSKICYQCPKGMNCFVGTVEPKLPYSKAPGITSQQPANYASNTSEVLQISNNLQITAVLLGLSMTLAYLLLSGPRQYLKYIDLYTKEHNHTLNEMMIIKTKPIGGLFSVLFILAAGVVVLTLLIVFSIDNIEESKALVPLVTLEVDYEEFIGEIRVSLTFESYFGTCSTSGGQCVPEIDFSSYNIKGTDSTTCIKAEDVCTVFWVCNSCHILTGARLEFQMAENLSYSDRIIANVTASSSIPDEYSSIEQKIASSYNTVFRGSTQNKFYFEMTPSVIPIQVFITDSSKWETDLTGYHVAATQAFEPGSVVLISE